jgi:hypothetical protein
VPRPSVYLETTIVSYLVGWLSRNSLLVASNQELTREWWAMRRRNFELFASTAVVDEARKGEGKLAAERLEFLREVELLDVTADTPAARGETRPRSSDPGQSGNGCAPHRRCRNERHELPLILELHAHRQRRAVHPADIVHANEPPFICTPQELMGDL